MVRGLLVVATLAAVVAASSPALQACGDKFLRAGRSARADRGYAAVFPASILIYTPNGTAKGVKDFESLLRKAGHKPVAVTDRAALTRVAASGKYDVVIADYSAATLISEQFAGAVSSPSLLPILQNADNARDAQTTQQYRFVLQPEKMTKYDALEQIDQLMKLRRTAAAASVPQR